MAKCIFGHQMAVQSSNSPGVRAGHASVSIGSKVRCCRDNTLEVHFCYVFHRFLCINLSALQVYIIGGVGDREYYNDVWMLDINCCTWIQLDVSGPEPQGRFSHTAVLAEGVITIYGGYMGKTHSQWEFLFWNLAKEYLVRLGLLIFKTCFYA